jgi:hypothetical protein
LSGRISKIPKKLTTCSDLHLADATERWCNRRRTVKYANKNIIADVLKCVSGKRRKNAVKVDRHSTSGPLLSSAVTHEMLSNSSGKKQNVRITVSQAEVNYSESKTQQQTVDSVKPVAASTDVPNTVRTSSVLLFKMARKMASAGALSNKMNVQLAVTTSRDGHYVSLQRIYKRPLLHHNVRP